MKRLKYIVFSGIDGSGKTTKARLSQLFLSRIGVGSYYVWFRWNAYVSYLVLFIAKITRLTVRKKIGNQVILIREYYRNKALARLWIITQSIDFLISHIFHTFRAHLNKAQVIIYDRFVIPDKIVDLIYETRINVFRNIVIRALIYYFISNIKGGKMIVIFNKVSPRKVLVIRKDIPSPIYPFIYNNLYDKVLKLLADAQGLYVLDSEKKLKENLSLLRNILKEFLRSRQYNRG